jgi:maltooligosyltrehalose trehalohydrolase
MGDGATLRLVANLSDKDMARPDGTTGTLLWGGMSDDRLPPWSVIWHLGG